MICTQVTQISHSTVGSSFSVSFSANSTPSDLEMLRMMREWFMRWNNSGVSFTKADTPQTDCDTCRYGQDKHRYAHICNECGVGINNYTPQTDCDKCIWNVCNYNKVDWDADTPQTETQTETQNSNLSFEKVMEEIQAQVIEFPDTHQKFVFARKIEMDGDSIKIGDWDYKGVKAEEREGE